VTDESSEDYSIYREFLSFISKYNKFHSTMQNHINKFKVFKNNYIKIFKHNKDQQFKMEINKFSDLNEDEFLEIYGNPMMVKEENEIWEN
jgi:hypothetical protein